MRYPVAATLVALCLQSFAAAMPALMSSVDGKTTLVDRGFNGMGLATLWIAVREYMKDLNAYDPSTPGKCALSFTTRDGGGCSAGIQCRQTDKPGYALQPVPGDPTNPYTWNVCYINGRQFFTHPQIGDFSITFTQAGGIDGNTEDGLHHPVLQFANFNNWEKFDVQSFIEDEEDQPHGKLCKKEGGRILTWTCGIPQIGQALYGLSNYNPPSNEPGYTSGWCTMHVVQHQRNEYGVGADYAFDVVIFDHVTKKQIGQVQKASIDPVTKKLNVTSHLPWVVVVTAAGNDHDGVEFRYGDQTWVSGTYGPHMSTLGDGPEWGYENGNRKGDMGFTC